MKWRIDNPFRTEHVRTHLTDEEFESLALSPRHRIFTPRRYKRSMSVAGTPLKDIYFPAMREQMNAEVDIINRVRENAIVHRQRSYDRQ